MHPLHCKKNTRDNKSDDYKKTSSASDDVKNPDNGIHGESASAQAYTKPKGLHQAHAHGVAIQKKK